MLEERLVHFRPRTVLVVLGIIVAGYLLLQIVQAAQGILIWIFVAIFLALALNPAVDALQRRGVRRRGLAVTIVFVGAILAIAALAATVIPTIVSQVNDFIDAVPGYVEDLTRGEAGSASSSASTRSPSAYGKRSPRGARRRSSASPARRSRSPRE